MFVVALAFWWLAITSIPWLLWLSSFPSRFEWPFVFRRVGAVSALSLPCLVLMGRMKNDLRSLGVGECTILILLPTDLCPSCYCNI